MKREIREQRLHDIVERYIAHLTRHAPVSTVERAVDLIAYSPESPVALAVAARLGELQHAGATIRAIFTNTMPEPLLAEWLAKAGWVRALRDKRLLEAHEQLILGETRCWSGDAMRRGATKTDLFESLNEGSREMAAMGRRAFDKLTPFASIIRPRRVTASLNAIPQDRVLPAPTVMGNVVPAPDLDLASGPFFTRH